MLDNAADLESRIDQWLENKVTQHGECLLWTGAWSEGANYPTARYDGAELNALRVIYNERVSLLGMHEVVFASCGESRCVNPDHLDARPSEIRGRAAREANARKYRRSGVSAA